MAMIIFLFHMISGRIKWCTDCKQYSTSHIKNITELWCNKKNPAPICLARILEIPLVLSQEISQKDEPINLFLGIEKHKHKVEQWTVNSKLVNTWKISNKVDFYYKES